MVAVVHAYADEPYDRSSFHLAGNAQPVAEVASMIAIQSIEGLASLPRQSDNAEESRHPFVGLVDHISVMPLLDATDEVDNDITVPSAHGEAAQIIGERLKKIGVQVFYYGDAHAEGTPLAVVRRERTNFFKTGGLESLDKDSDGATTAKGVATVGAPSSFVENFNIRLTSNCDLKTARSLTKILRERDGGLLGFEGLTLPYSNGRYEIAGNLLRPDVGSSEAVVAKLDEWVEQKLKELPFDKKSDLVDEAYRVGTTRDTCMDSLGQSGSAEAIAHHDQQVTQRFKQYLTGLPQ
jgi:hypothetical protein